PMSATAPVAGALGAALLLALSGSARAQLTEQAAAYVSAGVTNNALFAPDPAPYLPNNVFPDAFTIVRASVQAAYGARRAAGASGRALRLSQQREPAGCVGRCQPAERDGAERGRGPAWSGVVLWPLRRRDRNLPA